MSNEYKWLLKKVARDFLSDTLLQDSETGEYLNLGEVEESYSDISIELDHVYAQAAKADEYEAKAKAWDRTQTLLEKCTHQTPGDDYEVDWHEFEIKIDEVISDYESGELNAEK